MTDEPNKTASLQGDAAALEATTTDAAPPVNGADIKWNGKLPLRKEIPDGNGGMTKELDLREPTAADIERIGQPVLFGLYDANPKPIFDTRLMTAMLAHLARLPAPSIRAMHPRDWNNAAWHITYFFMPDL